MNMRMTKKFKMQIAAKNVNLYKWVTEMTPARGINCFFGKKSMEVKTERDCK
jgi:hypothetical protein